MKLSKENHGYGFHVSGPHVVANLHGPLLDMSDVRLDPITGRPYIHMHHIQDSDIHFNSKFCRAKRVAMFHRDFKADTLTLGGDFKGGIEMGKKDTHHMGPFHRLAEAQIFRNAYTTSQVTAVRGNHEVGIDRHHAKSKTIYGVTYCLENRYIDPKGRVFEEVHGDKYRPKILRGENQAFWDGIGDSLLNVAGEVDHVLQERLGLERASVTTWSKYRFKDFINKKMGMLAAIEEDVDARDDIDGLIFGDSHMQGVFVTKKRKVVVNGGSSTDHKQGIMVDRHGTMALYEHHRDHIDLQLVPSGYKYTKTYAEMGLDSFGDDPAETEDKYTAMADRMERIAALMWPAKDKQGLGRKIAEREHTIEKLEASLANATGHKDGERIERKLEKQEAKLESLKELRRVHPYPRSHGMIVAKPSLTLAS